MPRYRCNSCGGEYNDPSADGTAYYHACPPVEVVTYVDAKGARKSAPLRSLTGLTLADTDEQKAEYVTAGVDPSTIVVVEARHFRPRKDARDERTWIHVDEAGAQRIPVSEGLGRTQIADVDDDSAPVSDVL